MCCFCYQKRRCTRPGPLFVVVENDATNLRSAEHRFHDVPDETVKLPTVVYACCILSNTQTRKASLFSRPAMGRTRKLRFKFMRIARLACDKDSSLREPYTRRLQRSQHRGPQRQHQQQQHHSVVQRHKEIHTHHSVTAALLHRGENSNDLHHDLNGHLPHSSRITLSTSTGFSWIHGTRSRTSTNFLLVRSQVRSLWDQIDIATSIPAATIRTTGMSGFIVLILRITPEQSCPPFPKAFHEAQQKPTAKFERTATETPLLIVSNTLR